MWKGKNKVSIRTFYHCLQQGRLAFLLRKSGGALIGVWALKGMNMVFQIIYEQIRFHAHLS